ncbi:hypothetical protein JOL79_30550 [Microbispora sp. RL4-1S]|uniref:Antigen 84 n=1 Tax=Microbispora oryzae TaxID=2806554 RepID=A0A940WNG2_9ACTN|nr:hypothetical protein [Microbispora oryzae]MBP2708128.1 hypothetical protein [Microbispora oryzae]
MTNQTDNFPDLMSDDSFEVVMRGYSRRQVHDYMIRTRNQIRDLEERLARTIDQAEQGRIELAEARRKMAESPQNPDELGERLSQILKLAHEEAAANKEASEAEANRLRDNAAAEAERLVTSAREQADAIRTAAQEEAERRVADATASAERLLAQAGADAEETLGAARAEADETLRAARAESERTLADARGQAEAMLSAAQQRVNSLDEHTGRRVAYLTDTHTEVVRRLTEVESVLGDLLHREAAAGPLIDEAAVLPPAPVVQPHAPQAPVPAPADDNAATGHDAAATEPEYAEHLGQRHDDIHDTGRDSVRDSGGDTARDSVHDSVNDSAHGAVQVGGDEDESEDRVILDDRRGEDGPRVAEDTDVDLGRVRADSGEQESLRRI